MLMGVERVVTRECPRVAGKWDLLMVPFSTTRRASRRCNSPTGPMLFQRGSMIRIWCRPPGWSRWPHSLSQLACGTWPRWCPCDPPPGLFTLAEPTPSGSTGVSRLCQGCSHRSRHLPRSAALSPDPPIGGRVWRVGANECPCGTGELDLRRFNPNRPEGASVRCKHRIGFPLFSMTEPDRFGRVAPGDATGRASRLARPAARASDGCVTECGTEGGQRGRRDARRRPRTLSQPIAARVLCWLEHVMGFGGGVTCGNRFN